MQYSSLAHFIENTTLISYSRRHCDVHTITGVEELYPLQRDDVTQWINTFGSTHDEHIKAVILKNELDDFLIKLLTDEYSNKVIELDDILFVAIEVLKAKEDSFIVEKMAFILNGHFVWSIQEEVDDDFQWIKDRLITKKGVVRTKKSDYLFFLMLESIIDDYQQTLVKISEHNDKVFDSANIKATPAFTSVVEARKQEMFRFKKATRALRDAITKLEQVQLEGFNKKYFGELKDQVDNLMSDVDFELQELESKINLIFSIQGHQLNEVMKTLTIFSIIFTPLSFLCGLYGMNFENIPELRNPHGYFILLAVMLTISLSIIVYFKRKKWF